MSVFSNWTITWDPSGGTELVLLDEDHEMDAELEFPWEQVIEERQVIEGTGTEPLPRGLVKGSLTFTVFRDHADDAAARTYLLGHRTAIDALKSLRKTLSIEWDGGSKSFANAVFVSAVPRMVVEPDVARTAFTYTLAFPS